MTLENSSEDPASQPPKRHEKIVYIFNLSEDVWPFIQAISDPIARALEIEENADLADKELFSIVDEPDAIFISPKPLDPSFISYYQEVCGVKQVTALNPKAHSGMLCRDIIGDPSLMAKLVVAANSVKKLTLISYTASEQFYDLVDALRAQGITVYTPEAPEEESGWTVNFFGSKSGIRQLAQQSAAREPDLKTADGVVVSGIHDAAKIAAHKYVREHGVVIKTNKGHSGFGVLIFREGELPSEYAACEKAIMKTFKKDAYWNLFPIIIESYINVNFSVAGGFPDVEFKIAKNGKIDFLYHCGARVDKNGVFHGIEINESILSDRITARLIDTGFYIAEQYATSGYRGFFDIDFVASKNGEMYVAESNVRRTGGTFVWSMAEKLIGKDFMSDRYICSDNSLVFSESANVTFNQVHTALGPVLFDKKSKEGVVITSSNLLRYHRLGYVVFGATQKKAFEIETEMKQLLLALTVK